MPTCPLSVNATTVCKGMVNRVYNLFSLRDLNTTWLQESLVYTGLDYLLENGYT